jgi:murein DD-endopeptidase MepM/ murein hydrolase activator NlpD
LPTEGQFVEVFLDRGDSGAFNLQKGRYQGTIVNLADARQQLGNLEIPWALVGGGPEFAFKSRGPGKRQPLPSWALNKVGMPFKGNFPVTSPWGPPGSTRTLQRDNETKPSSSRHGGVDFGTPGGTEILAIAPGKVTGAKFQTPAGDFGYGGYVTIQHTNKDYEQDPGKTVYSVYAHLQSWPVSVGKTVEAGDVIGIVAERGARGRGSTTGPHLHLEVWVNAPYSPSKDFKYGQGPPITQTQNSTTGYSVDFWEWYIDNARKLGQTGPPERTNEDPPTQSSTAGTNAGSTEVTEGSERRQERRQSYR